MSDYSAEIDAWRATRLKNLMAETGWLNLVGRAWLSPGTITLGSAPDNDVVLSGGPTHIGTVTMDADGVVTITSANGLPSLHFPASEASQSQQLGSVLIEIHLLNGRRSIRVRDRDADPASSFPGIASFPVDPSWRVTAKLVALDSPLDIEIDTAAGIPTTVTATHRAEFSHAGTNLSLLATHGTYEKPMFVFKDQTGDGETYSAARFVYGENRTDDQVTLDFNKTFNPPCAFTSHALCPMPPQHNVLPVRVAAGELKPL